ncbi:MAG: two-component sensor histidine kinase [Pelagibacterales bacterium MED-G40]|nr:MAG: two-component sensor histidine kinase [Pelagibacterales bacterium MED-G40]|tara:strand:+ start:4012 stop:5787 length:1776 start_codon:yes stop_codon:yes gene_type:complete
MFKIIKGLNWIIITSILCITLGIVTFLTFINQGFLSFSERNLQVLLIIDVFLLIIFFSLIFKNVVRLYSAGKRNKTGSQTNIKYISVFSLFTFIPSLLIAIFSLFLFNFGIQNFFNEKITQAVNNSYDVAQNYLDESKLTIKSDVFLMSVGINRASGLFYSNQKRFNDIIRSEKLLRRVDDIYLIDSSGNILFSDTEKSKNDFFVPSEENFSDALSGLPIILPELGNRSSALIKLNNLIDTYLYISRNIDPEILKYLNETEEAVNFYYTVENRQTGLKITFAIIYIIVVTLLLFLSTVVAISFAGRLTKPIINLITASENISKGELDVKVPDVDTDDEFKMLNQNFNNMIEKLKKQQDKLLTAERYSAWETVARKLAHEIKNPLTPIQLSIDRLNEKYSNQISKDKENFINYLKTISRQIKDIENLTNEFSSFARMPSPVMKKVDILEIVKRAVDFVSMSSKNKISILTKVKKVFARVDEEQIYRVLINLIKNSEESFLEKKAKNQDFNGKIDIEINKNNDYIFIQLTDNGTGIRDTRKVMTPYFTTKKSGTGLGLPIVSKIINEHSGDISLNNNKNNEGLTILITLPINT